ncbi:GNAT family N-acetyltransferase [Nocardia brasiliensis]|uniref:GNAT family N-acetyltransferase n=1 Tax=Nocardia brasiliensis TaxID=37326 RepID=A0A6G9XTM2_NOCBR|nr:GNAT family N-acetyltransferase [Nocardia brasiliensis]QIS04246.1 GNAT family N-acetyltransferase [Nocardia brasiliensis]
MSDALRRLDAERRTAGERDETGDVVREWSRDRSECRISYVYETSDDPTALVAREVAAADRAGYELEWKTYEHDAVPGLERALEQAGFEPEPVESVLVRVDPPDDPVALADDRRIRVADSAADELADVAEILRATGRSHVERQIEQLRAQLDGSVFVHIAYLGDVPASCGRLHFGATPGLAELAGGRSKPEFRRRGLYTDLVNSRLAQSFSAGRGHVYVDALPTSEPILRRLGFRLVTRTRPFGYSPSH